MKNTFKNLTSMPSALQPTASGRKALKKEMTQFFEHSHLNPQIGIEPGKTRPVLTIQTNLLNNIPHPSTIVCPITTNVNRDSEILRVHLKKGTANLNQACDIMIDQIRAIDNKRLTNRLGVLPDNLIDLVKENVKIVLDLE